MKVYSTLFVFLMASHVAFCQIHIESPLRFLALGDSYTIGESVAPEERWPNQLFDSLKILGIDGPRPHIIAATGVRTDQLKNAIINSGLQDTFNLVSVLIGVNNQYQGRPINQFSIEFSQILSLAIQKAGGDTDKVFVVSIPDYAFTPFGQNANPTKISAELDQYNQIKDSITALFGLPFFNITPISRNGLNDPSLVASDGLHPSAVQYTQWVSLILKGLKVQQKPLLSSQLKSNRAPIVAVKGQEIVLNQEEVKQIDSLFIYTMDGKLVLDKLGLNPSYFPISIAGLPQGNYILKVNQDVVKFFKP